MEINWKLVAILAVVALAIAYFFAGRGGGDETAPRQFGGAGVVLGR